MEVKGLSACKNKKGSELMLELQNITWSTPEGEEILKGVSFSVPDNRMVAVTGPNGGGKTTIAKLIAGIEKPASGKILLDGEDITDCGVTERARKGISYAFQQPVRFKGLTVRDLIQLSAGEKRSEDNLCGVLSKVGLCAREYIDREVNSALSGGEIKRIEIATVLERPSKLAVFDEPEAGIDLWSFNSLISVFDELRKKQDKTLVIISHQERILSVADEIVVISGGEVTKHGSRDEVLPFLLNDGVRSGCPQMK